MNDSQWGSEPRHGLAVAEPAVSSAVSVASFEYFVPSDPMDELQCDSCQ